MKTRPRCRRCGKPMDFDHLNGWDANEVGWECYRVPSTDAEFWER